MNHHIFLLFGFCLHLIPDNTQGLLDKLIKGGDKGNCDCPCRDTWTVKCATDYETQCKPTYTGKECTKVPKQVAIKVKETECQKCVKYYETVLETKNKRECVTVYDEQCDTQYPAHCSTEQQCTMLYQTKCNTAGYSQKCSQVPTQKCTPVTKCHRLPQTNCKPVQRQKCGKVPVKIPKRVKKHSCSPYDSRDSSLVQTTCGSGDDGHSSGYGAPGPSSSYGAPAPSSNYGAPSGSLSPPSTGYNAGDFQVTNSYTSGSSPLNLTPDTIQSAPDSYGTPQGAALGAPDSYGTPQGAAIGAPDSYGTPQAAPNSYGSPVGSVQSAPNSYGSPLRSIQGSQDSYGTPLGSPQSVPDTYGSPDSSNPFLSNQGGSFLSEPGAPNSFGSPEFSNLGDVQEAPDSYGTPLGSPINAQAGSFVASTTFGSQFNNQGGSVAASTNYGSPQAPSQNNFASQNFNAQENYGSPQNFDGQGTANAGFQSSTDSYGSPPSNLFQAPDNYGSPQFGNQASDNYGSPQFNNNNNIINAGPDVSLATIRIVDPPNSVRSGNNPFLDPAGSAGRSKPYQGANFLAQQSQPVPTLQNANVNYASPNVNVANQNPNVNANRFTPEFIPSMRLPDNFEPNLDAMIIKTTERNDLLKKMKFPTDDLDVEDDYGHTNGLLRAAPINNEVSIQTEKPQGEVLDEASDDSEYDEEEEGDEQDTDEEYEDVELLNKSPEPPVGVGKMGKPALAVAAGQPDNVTESDKSSVKTEEGLDDKTLEKVLENILAEVEQTDNEEENLRQKKKRRIHPSQTLYGRKMKRRKPKSN